MAKSENTGNNNPDNTENNNPENTENNNPGNTGNNNPANTGNNNPANTDTGNNNPENTGNNNPLCVVVVDAISQFWTSAILMFYLYWLAEVRVLELLRYAEGQNQCLLELDLVVMNTRLMNEIGIHQIGNPVTIYNYQWTPDAYFAHDDRLFEAARTRLYIAQEYIRQLVSRGEPICTIPGKIHELFEKSKPVVLAGTCHIPLSSSIKRC